jgi:DNA-binding protein HU-beta
MNKSEFVDALSKKTGLTKVKSAEVVGAIFDTDPGKGIIAVELDAGRSVSIPGFGTFDTSHRKARQGRNPRTGEAIQIKAHTVPTFRAGKGLKERVYE